MEDVTIAVSAVPSKFKSKFSLLVPPIPANVNTPAAAVAETPVAEPMLIVGIVAVPVSVGDPENTAAPAVPVSSVSIAASSAEVSIEAEVKRVSILSYTEFLLGAVVVSPFQPAP